VRRREVDVRVEANNLTQLKNDLGEFIDAFPESEQDQSREIAELLVEEIKDSVDRNFDNSGSTGNLKGNVEKRQSSGGNDYVVSANAFNSRTGVNYAAWHEYASSGHEAPLKTRNGALTQLGAWAKRVGLDTSGFAIKVSPTSFMGEAVDNATSTAKRRINSGRSIVQRGLEETFGG
jgi:hypothetical protein